MRSLLTLAAALLATTLLLTACGDSTSIADPPVAPSSTSPSPNPPPKRETPEHFVRRWSAEDTRMQNTGDTKPFRQLSRHCSACSELADRIASIYDAGGYVRTRGWTIEHVRVISRTAESIVLNLDVDSHPTRYREKAGSPEMSLPGGKTQCRLAITPHNSTWNVTSLARVAS
jgi:hypothetical protein